MIEILLLILLEARPVVICPQERDINIFPLGSGAYFVSWPDPQCTSATGNPVDVTCVPPSPTTVFASAAVTFVTCTCTDLGFAGVSASCRFDIDLPGKIGMLKIQKQQQQQQPQNGLKPKTKLYFKSKISAN